MTYLLDTNAWIQFLNIPNSAVTQRLKLLQPNDVRLCTVVMAELYYGAWKSSRYENNLARVQGLWSQFEIVDFDQRSASAYGRIRANLESQGTPIGGNDLLIAAITLAHDLILVTHNIREFTRVEGLAIEDWEGN
jgi:tRNA(fMet)-specific endonuclease VapC